MLQVDIGKALAFQVTDEQLAQLASHDNVKNHVWTIGLRNTLMDCHASIKREDFTGETGELDWRNASKAKAELKFAAMLNGKIRSNSNGPRVSKASPIEAEALRLARVVIHTAKAKDGQLQKWATSFELPLGDTDKEKAVVAEAIKRYAAKESVMALAAKNVAAKAELVTDDLDL